MIVPHSQAAASTLLRAMHAVHTVTPPTAPVLSEDMQKLVREAEEAAAAACTPEEISDTARGSLYERAQTDGELLDEGVSTLLGAVRPAKDAVFADLGSGRGGALFRIAAATQWRHCFGIEVVESKHAAAQHALRALTSSPLLRAPVTLMQGDIVELGALASAKGESDGDGVVLGDLTHAYASSVCFDDLLLRAMARALADRKAFPRFQSLVSLRALPSQPYLTLVGRLSLTCSWNANVRGHVYVPSDVCSRDAADRAVPLLAHCLCDSGVCSLPAALQPWGAGVYTRMPR